MSNAWGNKNGNHQIGVMIYPSKQFRGRDGVSFFKVQINACESTIPFHNLLGMVNGKR